MTVQDRGAIAAQSSHFGEVRYPGPLIWAVLVYAARKWIPYCSGMTASASEVPPNLNSYGIHVTDDAPCRQSADRAAQGSNGRDQPAGLK